MQMHFFRKHSFQGVPNRVGKLRKFQGGMTSTPLNWNSRGMGGLKQKCPPRGYGYFLELHIKVLEVNALRKAIRELLLNIENYVSATISTSTIMDKSLGTVVQFERSLTYAKFISTRVLHCTSPPPPPTPRTVLKPSRQNFFDLSTLYWVGKGEGLWIF